MCWYVSACQFKEILPEQNYYNVFDRHSFIVQKFLNIKI